MADEKNITESKTYDIEGVEIFKAGKWNGDEYTVDDIDEMVNSFNLIGDKIKPYVKLGHDDGQKLLQKDGMPAAGWITSLRRVGDALVAKFSSVPQKIYDLIANKAYGRISSEIYWNLKDGPQTYKRVLKAVALLGANTPAVTTLDDFINLYTDNTIIAEQIKVCTEYGEIMKEEIDFKKYEAQIDELSEKLKLYEEQNGVLKSEADELKASVEAQKVEAQKAEIAHYLDEKIRSGNVVPAQVDKFTELALVNFDAVKDIIENSPKVTQLTEEQSQHVEVEKQPEQDEGEVLFNKITAYQKENKVSYQEAFKAIANGGNE